MSNVGSQRSSGADRVGELPDESVMYVSEQTTVAPIQNPAPVSQHSVPLPHTSNPKSNTGKQGKSSKVGSTKPVNRVRSMFSVSSANSKLEAERVKEVERQQELLQKKGDIQKRLVEAEKQAQLENIRLEKERLQAEAEAKKKAIELEAKLINDEINLSQRREKLLESRSSKASVKLNDMRSQAGDEKVIGWNTNLNGLETNNPPRKLRFGYTEEPIPSTSKAPDQPLQTESTYREFQQDLAEKRNNLQKPTLRVENEIKLEGETDKIAEALVKAFDRIETNRSGSRRDVLVNDRLDLSLLAARQNVIKDLPKFDGDPTQFPLFMSQVENSLGRFSQAENLSRIQKALVDKSPAKEAVMDLLNYPENVPVILHRLTSMFGKPEHIIMEIVRKIDGMPSITEKNVEKLVEFSTVVANLVSTLVSQNDEAHLKSPELIRKVLKKLPGNLQFDWAKSVAGKRDLTLIEVSQWISSVSEVTVSLMDRSVYYAWKEKQDDKKDTSHKRVNVHVEKAENGYCPCCYEGEHTLEKCKKFKNLKYPKRWILLKKFRICYNCLKEKHMANECPSKPCGINNCVKMHHRILHREDQKKPSHRDSKESSRRESEESAKTETNGHASSSADVLYKIVPVELLSDKSKVQTFAFLDEGSSVTLLEEGLVKMLNLRGTRDPLCMKWTDGTLKTEPESVRCSLKIGGSWKGSRKYSIDNVRSVKSLDLPTQSLNVTEIIERNEKFRKLPIESMDNARPRMIIGLQHYKLALPITVIEGGWDEPTAIKSRLGWYLYGNDGGLKEPLKKSHHSLHISLWSGKEETEEDLHKLVKSFFTTENFGVAAPVKPLVSAEVERAQKIFKETTHYANGRYETGLFWKVDDIQFPLSLQMAMKRHECLERKFEKDPEYAEKYREKIEESVGKGYMRKLTDNEIKNTTGKTWYLPHFGVINPNKKKLRIVHDAAAKVGQVSLNSMLLVGPDMYVALLGILFKFREGEIALGADIKEMFNQIKVRPEDQDCLRFLHRPLKDGAIEHMVCLVLLFGSSCSPAIAQMVKNFNATEFLRVFIEQSADKKAIGIVERAVEAILKRHWVDDWLDSFAKESQALEVGLKVKEIHQHGGFEIRNFVSNSPTVTSVLNNGSEPKIALNLDMESEDVDRVLGMYWNTSRDSFTYKLHVEKLHPEVLNKSRKMTKREFLRTIMSLYDPMGLLGHLIVQAKMILQNVWRSGISWDEELLDKDHYDWEKWWEIAKTIGKLEVPRCYAPGFLDCKNLQLHLFVDASERAFSAVAYWRIEHKDGVDVVLIGSKTKVAPLKLLSIPRLELQAAVLGNRFASTIQREHSVTTIKRFFWSDSQTVIQWLRSEHRLFKQFVAFRISEILETSEVNEWR